MNLDHFAQSLSAQLHRPAVPVRQQLDTLKRLGFTLPEALEAQALARPEDWEDPAYLPLLTRLAQADPGQVLALPEEWPRPEVMYQDLFDRLRALTGGRLDGRGAALAPAEADTRPLTFTLNGEACRYEAQDLGSWLDLGLLTWLNRRLAGLGEHKRLLTADHLRLPQPLVFFRSAQWGGFFTAGTGLEAREA